MAPALSGGNLDAIRNLAERHAAHKEDQGKRINQVSQAVPPAPTPPRDAHSPNHETRAQSPENPADFSEPETGPAMNQDVSSGSELEQLKLENADLRSKVAELEQFANETFDKAQLMEEQQKEMEKLLEEKSDLIRELHQKVQDLQARPAAATPREEELLALHEELEDERRQLKEDEEALMQQMRQMEVQMSRERAEMARQRNELQRLHGEIKHELELASREAELRDRLQPLQRRHQEMAHRKGAEPVRETVAAAPNHTPPQQPKPGKVAPPEERGIFKRLFGQ
jgi:DNA repair exonuclease SbcCD ATPase subunit